MWLQWLPWRWIIKRVARRQGFLDPFVLFSHLERFSQPSEVAAPTELLRSGAVLHARGLINSQAIQHNLDWVWPYWVERQFAPKDISFVPRAFSVTHINLTHRNWTAVGIPDEKYLPIVDPRGLVTPFYDGWSIDGWIITETNQNVIPSKTMNSTQQFSAGKNIEIITTSQSKDCSLISSAKMEGDTTLPQCVVTYTGKASHPAYLVVSIRPYNPEGISFIHNITRTKDFIGLKINNEQYVCFDNQPDKLIMSDYKRGDIYFNLKTAQEEDQMKCPVGMATAAVIFKLEANAARTVTVRSPLALGKDLKPPFDLPQDPSPRWEAELKKSAQLQIPDEKIKFIFDTAIKTLILHSPEEVYPGPFTYKRFWFRDAAFILDALLTLGYKERVKRNIDRFLSRQTPTGYFLSQEGEWDSNGEALWIIHKYCETTNEAPSRKWMKAVDRGGLWISRKRISPNSSSPNAGLLPAGFSAEHLGPNDFYYWDDFWGIAGLEAAYQLTIKFANKNRARHFALEAKNFRYCLERSLKKVDGRLGQPIIPASPTRRMDAGSIGSLAGSYPLRVLPVHDERMRNTINYLLKNTIVEGGFFQEMTHSGINPYLTLHIAQVLLRDGDNRYLDLVKAVADLASPTGQWPEAIHPHTKGGCMGDGQHVWAAAEWILMIKNCFIREEEGTLILASGIPLEWIKSGQEISLGFVCTTFGEIKVRVSLHHNVIEVSWEAKWNKEIPPIEVSLQGFKKIKVPKGKNQVEIKEEDRL